MKTLKDILKATKNAPQKGDFGIVACKQAINDAVDDRLKRFNETRENALFALLQGYLDRSRNSVFFNDNMIQACWQLINER